MARLPNRVLILGGAGFIGSHLAVRHLKVGDIVHVTVRPGWNGRFARPVHGAVAHHVDLTKVEQIEDCFAQARPTLVYHFASSTRHGSNGLRDRLSAAWLDDTSNLIRLLGAAKRVSPALVAFVRIGTLAEYGDGPVPSREDQREMPTTPYGLAQTTATRYANVLHTSLPFPVLTARLALTYGPGQRAEFLVPSLIRHCSDRQPYTINHPLDRRDMIYVDDVVAGLVKLATSALPGGSIVNICSGEALATRSIAETVFRIVGAPTDEIVFPAEPASASPASVVWGSPERAKRLLGWSSRFSFTEGIERTVAARSRHSYASRQLDLPEAIRSTVSG